MALKRGIKYSYKEFKPSKAYVSSAIDEYIKNGGKIKKQTKVLNEPDEACILFKPVLIRNSTIYESIN